MPRKLDPDRNPGEKAMSLFAKLLFSRKLHSISELAEFPAGRGAHRIPGPRLAHIVGYL